MNKKNKFYIKQSLKTQVNVTGIYTIHYFRYGSNFKYEKEKHNFYELVYIDSGNAVIVSDGVEIQVKQGEGFLHKPNSTHTIYTNNQFANSAIISFECANKQLLTICNKIITFNNDQKHYLNKVLYEAKISYSDPLDDLDLTKMNKREYAPYGNEQIIKNCTELLLISLLRGTHTFNKNSSPVVSGLYSPLVEKILAILKEKLDSSEQITLEELSFKTGYSKSQIKTVFKKETGKSILQFFIDIKIEKAKKLLSKQEKTVNEISYILGFTSVQYFCRQFKLRTDMTPSDYANSIKADNLI